MKGKHDTSVPQHQRTPVQGRPAVLSPHHMPSQPSSLRLLNFILFRRCAHQTASSHNGSQTPSRVPSRKGMGRTYFVIRHQRKPSGLPPRWDEPRAVTRKWSRKQNAETRGGAPRKPPRAAPRLKASIANGNQMCGHA